MQFESDLEELEKFFSMYFRYRESVKDATKIRFINQQGENIEFTIKQVIEEIEKKTVVGNSIIVGLCARAGIIIKNNLSKFKDIDGKMLDVLSKIYKTDNEIESRYFLTSQFNYKIKN